MVRHANRRRRADLRQQREREAFLECQRAVEALYRIHCAMRIQRAVRRTLRESGFVVV